jgi:hypothetical protein
MPRVYAGKQEWLDRLRWMLVKKILHRKKNYLEWEVCGP